MTRAKFTPKEDKKALSCPGLNFDPSTSDEFLKDQHDLNPVSVLCDLRQDDLDWQGVTDQDLQKSCQFMDS